MRFEELTLKIPGDEFRVRFHEHLTVVHGIGAIERSALVDSILGALAGADAPSELTYVDNQGRRITARAADGKVTHRFEDGTFAPSVIGAVAPDELALRELVVVRPDDLGLRVTAATGELPEELVEARALLGVLTRELQEALAGRQSVENIRDELFEIERQIRTALEDKGRRQYARVLADIERVRGELAVAESGGAGAKDDLRLLAAEERVAALAERWRRADDRVAELRLRFGNQARLNSVQLAGALAIPQDAPSELEVLARALDGMERERAHLAARLEQLCASRLPEASDPTVADLARVDQTTLWEANRIALGAAAKLEAEQVALGGLGPGGKAPAIADRIEEAHLDVVAAERVVERLWMPGIVGSGMAAMAAVGLEGFVPDVAPLSLAAALGVASWALVRPRRKLAALRKRETEVLGETGAATYLSFQMRRVEAVIDPEARQRLEGALLDHRMAMTRWSEYAGQADPADAAAMEHEVRAYAEALSLLGSAAEEIEGVRIQLTTEVEPAVEHARRTLLAACEPFGITDPAQATDLVRERLDLGRRARLQSQLEEAEKEEDEAAAALDAHLRDLGFDDGLVDTKLAAFDRAATRAQQRAAARARARSPEQIEEELSRLEAEAMVLRRPEWSDMTAADAVEEPDVEVLRAEMDRLRQRYQEARSTEPNIDRIADRHNALERRVAALESQHGHHALDPGPGALVALQDRLMARLTAAAHAGPARERVPLLLDEAFVRVPEDRKVALLDMIERLGEKVQLVYLTDDPVVGAWARRKAAEEAITLLEPVGEPAV